MHLFLNSPRALLVLAVILVCQGLVQAQGPVRNITIPTPTSEAERPNSSSAGNATSSVVLSRNATSTAFGNSTNSNSTRTSSQPDPTKPFATDFKTQTYRVPAPAGPGGGNVAQSPDDSVSRPLEDCDHLYAAALR